MPESGPHVAAALLCETVIQEQSGVLSLIRIVDQIVQEATGPEPPDTMPPVSVSLKAVIMLKADKGRGRHTVTIQPEDPSGMKLDKAELPVQLQGEDRGVNLVVELNFVAELEGLYWFDVHLGPKLLTRMPLRLIYAPTRTPG